MEQAFKVGLICLSIAESASVWGRCRCGPYLQDLEVETLFEREYARMSEAYASLAQLRDSLHARGDWESLLAADALVKFKSIEVRWLLYDRSRLHARRWEFTNEECVVPSCRPLEALRSSA